MTDAVMPEMNGGRSFDRDYTEGVEQPCQDGTTVWTEVITSYCLEKRTGHLELRVATPDIIERKRTEKVLQQAMADIKAPRGILPKCEVAEW